MDNMQDQIIGLILISSGLKKISVQKNLIFTRGWVKINFEGQSGLTYPIFTVMIRNLKKTGEFEYDLRAPLVAYKQNTPFFVASIV